MASAAHWGELEAVERPPPALQRIAGGELGPHGQLRLGRGSGLRLGFSLGDLGQRRIFRLGVGFRCGELVLQFGSGRFLDRLVDRLGCRRHAEHRTEDIADGTADHAA